MTPARFAKLRAVYQYIRTHRVTVYSALAIPLIEWGMHWLNGRHACGHTAAIFGGSIGLDVWDAIKCRTRTAGQVAGDIIDAANKCPDEVPRPAAPPAPVATPSEPPAPIQEMTHPPLGEYINHTNSGPFMPPSNTGCTSVSFYILPIDPAPGCSQQKKPPRSKRAKREHAKRKSKS